MFEREDDLFYEDSHKIGKFILELLRNILVVSTIRFISEKSGSLIIHIIDWISVIALGLFLLGYVWSFRFKKIFFL